MSMPELKSGQRVVYRNGVRGIVLRDLDIIAIEGGGFNRLSGMGMNSVQQWTIDYVYDKPSNGDMLNFNVRGLMVWDIENEEALSAIKDLDVKLAELSEQVEAIKKSRKAIEKTLKYPLSV